MRINSKLVILFMSSMYITNCSTISQFDQQAYLNSTSIILDALNLMDSATDNCTLHQVQINNVTTLVEKAYEYDKNRPKNIISTVMWRKLKDTTGHLFGGFITRWKKEQTLKPVFI